MPEKITLSDQSEISYHCADTSNLANVLTHLNEVAKNSQEKRFFIKCDVQQNTSVLCVDFQDPIKIAHCDVNNSRAVNKDILKIVVDFLAQKKLTSNNHFQDLILPIRANSDQERLSIAIWNVKRATNRTTTSCGLFKPNQPGQATATDGLVYTTRLFR